VARPPAEREGPRHPTTPSAPAAATFFDLTPHPFQERILEELAAERSAHGHWRNLVIAATGTGKTVVAAFDFERFFSSRQRQARLLYVAHRQENRGRGGRSRLPGCRPFLGRREVRHRRVGERLHRRPRPGAPAAGRHPGRAGEVRARPDAREGDLESLTIFLQQLGRGLRRAPEKDALTVLDFVGQAHRRYRIDRKLKALLPRHRYGIDKEVELELHARYGSLDISSALGLATIAQTGQTGVGVLHAPKLKAYAMLITFQKTEREFRSGDTRSCSSPGT